MNESNECSVHARGESAIERRSILLLGRQLKVPVTIDDHLREQIADEEQHGLTLGQAILDELVFHPETILLPVVVLTENVPEVFQGSRLDEMRRTVADERVRSYV